MSKLKLQDNIAIGIAAGGYFCGALPMAVYAGQWGSVNGRNDTSGTAAVQSSASATSVSLAAIKIHK